MTDGLDCVIVMHVVMSDVTIHLGTHATKYFVNTGHPVIVALPDKAWKWGYIDKLYGFIQDLGSRCIIRIVVHM